MTKVTILTKSPSRLAPLEFGAFAFLARSTGEVSVQGLADRIRSAELLAFAYEDTKLLGIAALKNPVASYRKRISTASQTQLPVAQYSHELGWVLVMNEARGKGISKQLCQVLLAARSNVGVFATARCDNEPMNRCLSSLGFRSAGVPYESKRPAGSIRVHLR